MGPATEKGDAWQGTRLRNKLRGLPIHLMNQRMRSKLLLTQKKTTNLFHLVQRNRNPRRNLSTLKFRIVKKTDGRLWCMDYCFFVRDE